MVYTELLLRCESAKAAALVLTFVHSLFPALTKAVGDGGDGVADIFFAVTLDAVLREETILHAVRECDLRARLVRATVVVAKPTNRRTVRAKSFRQEKSFPKTGGPARRFGLRCAEHQDTTHDERHGRR